MGSRSSAHRQLEKPLPPHSVIINWWQQNTRELSLNLSLWRHGNSPPILAHLLQWLQCVIIELTYYIDTAQCDFNTLTVELVFSFCFFRMSNKVTHIIYLDKSIIKFRYHIMDISSPWHLLLSSLLTPAKLHQTPDWNAKYCIYQAYNL